MKVIYRSQRYWVSDGSQVYYPTAKRLTQAARSQGIGVVVKSSRRPRQAAIVRPSRKAIATDRFFDISQGLPEAAEIIYTLQKLDNKGKRQFYKKLNL